MRLKQTYDVVAPAAMSLAVSLVVVFATVSRNISSGRLEDLRVQRLNEVAKESVAGTCIRTTGDRYYKGQVIDLGEQSGQKVATTCVINERGEAGYIAYKEGRAIVQEVVSQQEINSRISHIKGAGAGK